MAKKRARLTDTQVEDITAMSRVEDILNLGDLEQLPVSMIPIDRIDPNPFQPRQHFPAEGITELATAMQANGFLGSLVGREVDGRYQLAFGERRLRAASEADIDRIPLHISPFTDQQMAEVAITENVNREDLTPIEEARGYQVLYDQFGYSYRNIGQRVGKSHAHVIRRLKLLEHTDIVEAVEENRINPSDADELAKVEDDSTRQQLIDQVATDQLNRAALREAVKIANEPKPEPKESRGDSTQPPPTLAPATFDPIPQLASALGTIRRIPPNRLGNVADAKRSDAIQMIDEMEARLKDIKSKLKK